MLMFVTSGHTFLSNLNAKPACLPTQRERKAAPLSCQDVCLFVLRLCLKVPHLRIRAPLSQALCTHIVKTDSTGRATKV